MKKIILFLFPLLFVSLGYSQVTYTFVEVSDSLGVAGNVTMDSSVFMTDIPAAATKDSILGWSGDSVYKIPYSSGTSNWDKSNDTITPTTGVNVVDIRTETFAGDGSLWFTDPHNSTNVMIGDGAGSTSATHGNDNVGIGRDALKALQLGGVGNVAIAPTSLQKLTTGDYNVGIGLNALSNALTTGGNNVAIGAGSLYQNNGDQNIAMGTSSGESLTASGAVALGYHSLWNGLAATGAVAVGCSTARVNANGEYSVSIGYRSMADAIGAVGSVGIGRGALRYGTGDYNVAIGYLAGENWAGSNALFIENSNSASPLIFGNFAADSVKIHGTFTTNNAFGEMYFSEADTISTATTSWYSPTKFTLGDFYGTSVVGDTAMVITQNGWYQVNASPSFKHAGTNVLIHYGIFVNDVLDTGIQAERTIGATGSQFGSASLSGIIKITNAPDTLQLKVNADKAGNLISNHTNVTATRIR